MIVSIGRTILLLSEGPIQAHTECIKWDAPDVDREVDSCKRLPLDGTMCIQVDCGEPATGKREFVNNSN